MAATADCSEAGVELQPRGGERPQYTFGGIHQRHLSSVRRFVSGVVIDLVRALSGIPKH